MTFSAGFTDVNQLVVCITNLTDCCSAFDRQQSHFAGRQLNCCIFAFFCHQLTNIPCGTYQLTAFAGLHFDVVDGSTNGDFAHGQCVAQLNFCFGAVHQMIANLQTCRSQNIGFYAVCINNQSDVCCSVGIVFNRLNNCRYAVFVTFKVNQSVFDLCAAAVVTYCQLTLVVSAGILSQVYYQRFFGRGFCNFIECGHSHVSSGWCIGFISLNCHLLFPLLSDFYIVYTFPCVLQVYT